MASHAPARPPGALPPHWRSPLRPERGMGPSDRASAGWADEITAAPWVRSGHAEVQMVDENKSHREWPGTLRSLGTYLRGAYCTSNRRKSRSFRRDLAIFVLSPERHSDRRGSPSTRGGSRSGGRARAGKGTQLASSPPPSRPANPAARAQAGGDCGHPPHTLRFRGAWSARTVYPRVRETLRATRRAAGAQRAQRAEKDAS